MKAGFEITMTAFALLLELVAGNAGFSIRLTAYVLFYFACADSFRNALIGAAATGLVLDLLLHRPLLLSPFLWRRRWRQAGDCDANIWTISWMRRCPAWRSA